MHDVNDYKANGVYSVVHFTAGNDVLGYVAILRGSLRRMSAAAKATLTHPALLELATTLPTATVLPLCASREACSPLFLSRASPRASPRPAPKKTPLSSLLSPLSSRLSPLLSLHPLPQSVSVRLLLCAPFPSVFFLSLSPRHLLHLLSPCPILHPAARARSPSPKYDVPPASTLQSPAPHRRRRLVRRRSLLLVEGQVPLAPQHIPKVNSSWGLRVVTQIPFATVPSNITGVMS